MTDFVAGDTGSSIELTCINSTTFDPINLSNYTVTIQWRKGTLNTRSVQIVNAQLGIIRYKFQANELVAGSMSFDVILTHNSTSQILTCKDLVKLDVRPRV